MSKIKRAIEYFQSEINKAIDDGQYMNDDVFEYFNIAMKSMENIEEIKREIDNFIEKNEKAEQNPHSHKFCKGVWTGLTMVKTLMKEIEQKNGML